MSTGSIRGWRHRSKKMSALPQVRLINQVIAENNKLISAKDNKSACIRMVWEELFFRLQGKKEKYLKDKAAIKKEADAFDKEVKRLQGEYKKLMATIRELNSKVINTTATVDSINSHLRDSGFEGFHLREKAGVKGTYEVIREDGTVAEHLSEGERNFIAFLYFYHVVRGSQSETDTGKNKIVVIDDPVSSMDSQSLFIVSSLIREMIAICSNNPSPLHDNPEYQEKFIQQIFILTHNAFFHREITCDQERHFRYVTLYRITKKNNESDVTPCIHRAVNVNEKDRNYNPVQSSYAALWREFESLDAVIPLMYVIRMILEYYFLQICRFDREEFIRTALEGAKKKDKEEGRESEHDSNFHMAQSLLKYIDRSGAYNDGLNFTEDSIDCDSYRHALEMIFEVMNQSQHYTRMMEEAD